MNEIYITSCFITFVVVFIQAFIVISKNKKADLVRSWFLVSVAIGVISWGLWGMVISQDPNQSLFFRYVLDLGLIFLPVLYFHFIVILVGVKKNYTQILKIFYGVAGLLVLVNFLPYARQQILNLKHSFNYWPSLSPMYILFLIFLLFGFGYAFYVALSRYDQMAGVVKNQIRYIVLAGAVGLVGGVTNFWPFIVNFFPWGNLFLAVSVIMIGYALVKYPLPSLKRILSLLYIYIFISIFVYLFFHLVSFVDVGYLGGIYTKNALLAGIVFSVLFSVILLPFLRYVQETSDILFFEGANPYHSIKDLSLKMNKTLGVRKLLKFVNKEFRKILQVEEVKIVVFDPLNREEIWEEYSASNIKFNSDISLRRIRKVKILGQLSSKEKGVANQMKKHNLEAIVPLFSRKEMVGLVLLGEKIAGEGYSEGDLEFLDAISQHLAAAVHNSLLYKKVEESSRELKEKVEEQTADIRKKNNKLQKMLAAQSEFLDIAGHQLRTPVSVIKGMLSIIKDDSISKKKREEFLDSVLQNAFKLEKIIETMLTASEVDSGNFGFDLEPVQLKPLMNKIYKVQKERADQRKIDFRMSISKKYLMPVLSNDRYLKQVIENLIDNAFQYTQEGGKVKINVKPLKEKVNIEISDTGIGVPKKERDNLFNKFSRAQNAVNTYGNGSGLGLFVVKKIIDTHTKDAKVYIKESEVNKGTTFVVSLPVVKNS